MRLQASDALSLPLSFYGGLPECATQVRPRVGLLCVCVCVCVCVVCVCVCLCLCLCFFLPAGTSKAATLFVLYV